MKRYSDEAKAACACADVVEVGIEPDEPDVSDKEEEEEDEEKEEEEEEEDAKEDTDDEVQSTEQPTVIGCSHAVHFYVVFCNLIQYLFCENFYGDCIPLLSIS